MKHSYTGPNDAKASEQDLQTISQAILKARAVCHRALEIREKLIGAGAPLDAVEMAKRRYNGWLGNMEDLAMSLGEASDIASASLSEIEAAFGIK